jgi:hypothetical protein
LEYLRSVETMEYLLAARHVRKMRILANSITPFLYYSNISLKTNVITTLIINGIVK